MIVTELVAYWKVNKIAPPSFCSPHIQYKPYPLKFREVPLGCNVTLSPRAMPCPPRNLTDWVPCFALGVVKLPFHAAVYPSTVSSANDVTLEGFYLTGDWTGGPSVGDPNGAVLVFVRNNNIYQIWFMSNSDEIYYRRRNSNGTWAPWHGITFS